MKIKFKLLTLLVFILASCISNYAQTNKPSSFLWEIKPKSDTSKVAYLLGSIHIATSDFYPLNPVIIDKWNKSDALVVELDILQIDLSSSFRNMSEYLFQIISFTDKLSDKLSPDLYKKIKNKLPTNELITEEFIEMFTPIGIAVILYLNEMSNFLSLDEYKEFDGIDVYFLKLAKEKEMPIYEIESISSQLKALFSMFKSLENNIISYLETMIDETNDNASELELNELMNAWKNGDTDKLDKLINNSNTDNLTDEQYKKMMDALLYNRNINMAKKIEEYLVNKETYFIIIGVGHYVGEKSIIDILQKTGKYNIKRL